MSPEECARLAIDEKLKQAGWVIQDMNALNLAAGLGVAIREFPTSTGEVDYALFVDGRPVGVVEAKRTEIPNFQYDARTRMQMRNSLTMPAEEVKRLVDGGEKYVVRFKVEPNEDVHVHDLIRGEVVINSNILDDAAGRHPQQHEAFPCV